MKEIIDALGMQRSLRRITHEIIEHNKGIEDIVLVGIKTRGEVLAKRLCEHIAQVEGKQLECYALDVFHWRDDHVNPSPLPKANLPVKDKKGENYADINRNIGCGKSGEKSAAADISYTVAILTCIIGYHI